MLKKSSNLILNSYEPSDKLWENSGSGLDFKAQEAYCEQHLEGSQESVEDQPFKH